VDQADAAGGLTVLVFLFTLLVNLAACITFIVWIFKSAKLSELLAPGQQRMSPGWAIGGWFIPLGYFVIPRLVMGDIWRACRPLDGNGFFSGRGRTVLVTWWWITFCLGQQFVGAAATNIQNSAYTHDAAYLSGMFIAVLFFELMRVTSAVLAIVMLRRINSRQQVRILQGPGYGNPYSMQSAMAYAGMPAGYPAPQQFAPQQFAPDPYLPQPYLPQQADAPAAPATPTAPTAPMDAVPADAVPAEAVPSDAVPTETAPTVLLDKQREQ
jgi:hypothetical protein